MKASIIKIMLCGIYLCESINGQNYAGFIYANRQMDKIMRNLFMRIDKWTKLCGIYLCESINGQNYA